MTRPDPDRPVATPGDRPFTARPVLIHIHVPKCAGSSVNYAMAQARPGRVISNHPHVLIEKLAAQGWQRNDAMFDAVAGHIVWGLHTQFSRPYIYFSILRDPVDRICSFYNFIHATPDHPLHERFREGLPDLNEVTADFIDKAPGLKGSWSNYLCHALLGRRLGTPADQQVMQRHMKQEIHCGRMLVGDVAAVELLLYSHAILPAGESLPKRNVTSELPGGYNAAHPGMLSSRVRDLLGAINDHDFALLDFLHAEGLVATAGNFAGHPAAGPFPVVAGTGSAAGQAPA